jgi:peptide deformylase
MSLPVLDVGHPVLRQIARPLTPDEIRGSEIQRLIQQMRDTMYAAPGVGLAAPQVGRSLQLAVIEDREEYHKDVPPAQLAAKERKPVDFHVLINPRIVWQSEKTKDFFEGCLSLEGYSAVVRRAHAVRVQCLDESGQSRLLEASGWYARILQHEIDHLLGNLYIDHMQARTFTSLDNFSEFWKNLPPADVLADPDEQGAGSVSKLGTR